MTPPLELINEGHFKDLRFASNLKITKKFCKGCRILFTNLHEIPNCYVHLFIKGIAHLDSFFYKVSTIHKW